MGKVARDITLQETNECLRAIRDVLSYRGGKIYGFHINIAESDPEDAVTYLADAVGMTPAHMDYTNNVFDWGSWQNAFFIPRPCMLKFDGTVDYYLNPNDYTKKYGSNAASDVANVNYGGNAMMEWGRDGKKIWYKIVPDSDPTSASVYIANYQADDDFRAWSFVNNQGQYVDHFYTPIYNGSVDGSGRMRSVSGATVSKSLTAAQEREKCRANNSSLAIWDTEVYCDIILINFLLTLMSKSLNSQTAFGKGLTSSGSETVNNGFTTGIHNGKGLFYGTNSGAAGTYTNAVKVFGMENWWGFQWRRFGGLVNDNGTAKYKMTRGTQDGSSASDYVISTASADYAGYLTGGAVPSVSGNYISKQTFDRNQCAPSAVAGNSAQYYCDAFWSNNGQVDYALRGGFSADSDFCGAWYLYLYASAGAALWPIGSALSCKPLS